MEIPRLIKPFYETKNPESVVKLNISPKISKKLLFVTKKGNKYPHFITIHSTYPAKILKQVIKNTLFSCKIHAKNLHNSLTTN